MKTVGRAPEQRRETWGSTHSFLLVLLEELLLNLFLSLSVIHHQEALEGVQVLKEWVQI